MVAPAADFDIQDASALWGLEDAADLANISGNFNVNEINKKVYGGQDKVFDFDEILDDQADDHEGVDGEEHGKLLRNDKRRVRLEKIMLGNDANLNNKSNKFKNLMTEVSNPAPTQNYGSYNNFDKMHYDFKKMAVGADNPVEALLSDPLNQQNASIDTILEDARKVDLLTSICNK